MPRRSLRPRHCGRAMRDVTESDERALGIHAFLCDRCKFECQALDDYEVRTKPPALPDRSPTRGGLGINRDPQLYGIIRRSRRYEARIASGSSGVWLYVGLYRTVYEAVKARDEAIKRRKAA